ncbi:MAG: lytic transglycosylase domain-containing protein [Alphaproteobacteria bacterium]|nr:lytic transglycosylase domain-containing protein [Alphaproteobacteria bacterium]
MRQNRATRPARSGLALAAILLGWLAAQPGLAADAPGGGQPRPAALPALLSPADIQTYRTIFTLNQKTDFDAAEKLIGTLSDRVLTGYIEAEKLLHPTAYRASYPELRAWLQRYADQPQADEVRALAIKRRPKGAAEPPRLVFGDARPKLPGAVESLDPAPIPVPRGGLSASDRTRADALRADIRRKLHTGSLSEVRVLLSQEPARRLLSNAELDDFRVDLASGLFFQGDYAGSLVSAELAMRSTEEIPLLHWWGGISAWRLGKFETAQMHFEQLAVARNASPWNAAAGAFWAARAHLVARNPVAVNSWLEVGAKHGETFYGILSRRALSIDLNYDWTNPTLTPGDWKKLAANPIARRGLALLQVGRPDEAEEELARVAANEVELRPALLAVASAANLPYLSIRLGSSLPGSSTATRYPTGLWTDEEFQVDRALVLAVIRQESRFDAHAVSPAGARGLMQLMPATASYMSREVAIKRKGQNGRDRLFESDLNFSLGQRYLSYLLDNETVGRDLFRMAVAYNAGPGKLRSWERTVPYEGDALLFIESIPSQETRLFIERVLSNLWIYRHRLGQDAPDLAAVAAGDWPRYVESARKTRNLARRDGN